MNSQKNTEEPNIRVKALDLFLEDLLLRKINEEIISDEIIDAMMLNGRELVK